MVTTSFLVRVPYILKNMINAAIIEIAEMTAGTSIIKTATTADDVRNGSEKPSQSEKATIENITTGIVVNIKIKILFFIVKNRCKNLR
jgi:hypothetical protein